jgi:amino acid adenylation domain-containing protein
MSSVDKSANSQGQQQLWNSIRSALNSARKGSPIDRVTRTDVLPLSFAQQRFWFIAQLSPASSVNNLRLAFGLRGRLDPIALERSLREIVRRHEILRTTFHVVDGKSTQVIEPDPTLTLEIVDLPQLLAIDAPEERLRQRETAAQQQLNQTAQQPFDLTQGPLLRVKLIRLDPETHQILVIMHHIIGDGLSIEIFFKELATLYTAFSTNQLSPLKDRMIQYADFAVWQHQRVESGILSAQLDYWKQQLGTSLPILQLPTDRPHPPVQTASGAYQFLELPHHLTEALQSLSKQEGVTLFMTLLAAFKILLHRYSGQEDIVVGTPSAGRNRPEIAGSIGCFINTLVLRTNLAHNPSFQELLNRVQQVAVDAYAHQDLPFEKLIEVLNPVRDLSRSPLFQVMFVFETNTSDTWVLPGLICSHIEVPSPISNFEITLNLTATTAGIRGGIEYNPDLFDATTIERMRGHFQTLLAGIVTNPAQQISDLPLLTSAEQQQILVEWNHTQIDYPKNVCIHQLFEAQVQRTPDAIAVIVENDRLSYHQLNCRSNQLADRLHGLGVTADVLVGILMERSIDLVVGLLGILKAGGAYLPLDPTYPPARLNYMLTDAGVEIVLTQSQLRSIVPGHPAQIICLDRDWQAMEDYCQDNLDRGSCAADLAYVIYTSGSTGQPKGVAIEHRNVVNFLCSMSHAPGLKPADTLTAITTISFDIAALELYLPLIIGAKVIVVPREIAIDAARLLSELRKSQTTVLQATPVTWQLLLASGWDANYPLKVLCGGETLPDRLAQQILATGSELWNLYGPTETTIWSTLYRVRAAPPVTSQEQALVSIGRPIANTQIYILNQQLQPVPIGVAGELHIGGAGVVRGYLNQPELTAAKFIPNPFSTDRSARLYKTGDLARYSIDGTIEFLGRIDDLVKIRGFRIELGEIETALSQHPMVSQVVVVTREITPDHQSLIAYILPHQNCTPTTHEFRSFLKQQLPEYMIPAIFSLLETLPLTANGKIDRRALPIPNRASVEPAATLITPRDGLELQLTKMWERVLGIQPIGASDNFFNLGGHSVLAVELFAQITKMFDQNLPLATLFHSPTIEQLATILRQDRGSTTWSSLVPIASRGSKPPLFCAHAVGGNVLDYYPLAAHLGSEQPIYGLQSLGLDGVQTPLNRIEDMAARYIREIKSVQPDGPYFLVGYSFGALVAFEIACQLERQGERIGLLALLDNAAPNLLQIRPSWWQSIRIHLRNLHRLQRSEQIKYITDRIVFRLIYQNKANSHQEFLLDHWGKTLPPEYLKVLDANFQAGENYIGKFYPGQVTLFRSDIQSLAQTLHPDLGWSNLVGGGLEIYNIPGHHSNLLQEPSVQILAKMLKFCLASDHSNFSL